jgi:hypothetical protein
VLEGLFHPVFDVEQNVVSRHGDFPFSNLPEYRVRGHRIADGGQAASGEIWDGRRKRDRERHERLAKTLVRHFDRAETVARGRFSGQRWQRGRQPR